MRKWLLALLTLVLMLAPHAAQAQEQISLASLKISLWPEFDRPSMLVIYRIELSPDTSFPAKLVFRIPASAGEPSAVAGTFDSRMVDTLYTRTVEGEWALISFETEGILAQLEYYDSALDTSDVARNYVFTFPGDYAVNSMTVQLQQPFDALNVVTTPALGAGRIGNDGLLYQESSLGAQPSGQNFVFSVGYEKQSNLLSQDHIVQSGAPGSVSSPPSSPSAADLLPWGLGLAGLVLIGLGVSRLRQPAPRRRSSAKRTRSRSKPAAAGSVFCHECGDQASQGDKYCRECGTLLRSS
ncbi:MAG: hypothetical protein OEZ02_13350 [Anaerolineae bacterium]|nr:hypothetical protein [Anaerolineae bacterium]